MLVTDRTQFPLEATGRRRRVSEMVREGHGLHTSLVDVFEWITGINESDINDVKSY